MAGLAQTRGVRGVRARSGRRGPRAGDECEQDGGRRRVRRLTPAGLVFLRGSDADARLRGLERERGRARPELGALAAAWVKGRAHEALGFRCLGDWSRERIGVGARAVRGWARVAEALAGLPRLRAAVGAGEVSWTVAAKVLAVATPETDAACVEAVRGRTVRAVEALLRAVHAAEGAAETPASEERVAVFVTCVPELRARWEAAVELARRVAGEALPVWEAAEAIAAEGAAALGAPERDAVSGTRCPPCEQPEPDAGESGLRAALWPHLPWHHPGRGLPDPPEDLSGCTPRELDARFRAAMRRLQQVDFEMGRLLRQLIDGRLYAELGFDTFERYVRERLDLSPRTARRLVRLARAEDRRPAVATAFRDGRITLLQAEALLRGQVSVGFAERVTLRRLEGEVPEAIAFSAPREVAALFTGMVARVGLERLLAHAIETWTQVGRQFRDYADFERDGYRCTVPACAARRNLQSHHIRLRSAGGPDAAWNRTTLCAFHHHRGVHAGRVRILGRAPDGLLYELGIGRFRSGDVRV